MTLITAVAWLATSMVLVFGAGDRIRRLVFQTENALERLVMSGALGFLALSYVCFALGALGLYRREAFYAVLAAGVVLGAAPFAEILRDCAGAARSWGPAGRAGAAIMGTLALMNAAGGLMPPVDTDVLIYHLAVPQQYINHGGIVNLGLQRYSHYVNAFGMNYVFAMGLHSDRLAQLYNGIISLLAAGSVGMLARWAAGVAVGEWVPWLASLAWYVMPDVCWQSFECRIDVAMGLYQTLAFYAAVRGRVAAAGLFCGFAAVIKYLGGFAGPAAALALMATDRMERNIAWKKIIARVAVVTVISAALAAPWYAKNFIMTGNPVWPVATKIFGSSILTPEKISDELSRWQFGYVDFPRTPAGMAKIPFVLTFDSRRLESGTPGPFYLALLPWMAAALVLSAGFRRRGALLLLFAAALFPGWFYSLPFTRFYLAGFAALAAGGAAAAWTLESRALRGAALCIGTAWIAMGAGNAAHHLATRIKSSPGWIHAPLAPMRHFPLVEGLLKTRQAVGPDEKAAFIWWQRYYVVRLFRDPVLMDDITEPTAAFLRGTGAKYLLLGGYQPVWQNDVNSGELKELGSGKSWRLLKIMPAAKHRGKTNSAQPIISSVSPL